MKPLGTLSTVSRFETAPVNRPIQSVTRAYECTGSRGAAGGTVRDSHSEGCHVIDVPVAANRSGRR